MTNNNLSRVLFNDFLEMNSLKRDGKRNVFIKDNKKYAFSLVKESTIECRQFYEDCNGLVCYSYKDDCLYDVSKDNLNISNTPTRISPNGMKAFNALGSIELAKKSLYII